MIQNARLLADCRKGRRPSLGEAATIGRVGGGPGEYKQPDGLFALPGDSTLLVDLGNARMTVLAPDLSFGATYPLAQRGERGFLIMLPRAVDDQGRVYFQVRGGFQGIPDSAAVGRYNRETSRIDTLAMVKLQDYKSSESGGGNRREQMIMPVPLTRQDGWSASWDGRVAIVRSNDYHVEWIQPDGSVVRGSAVEFQPLRVTDEDKEEWIEGLGNGISMEMMNANGQMTLSMSRGGRSFEGSASNFDWPDTKPAFRGEAVYVGTTGDAWVQRYGPAGSPSTFDIFSPDGSLTKRVVLPEGRRLVGFGDGVVYLAWADEFDLRTLERYSL